MQTLRQPLAAATRQATRRPATLSHTSGIVRQHTPKAFYSTPAPRDRSAGPPLTNPLNLPKWLESNSHLLKPPINNHVVCNDPLTVQIVGGPNARTDYHINSTPEFFYQHRGRMLLRTVDPASHAFRDIYIHQAELFLLPALVPHNPVRFADTVGVVLELPRPAGSVDRLRWYCQNCASIVHEASFYCTDLGTQIQAAVQGFESDAEARKCRLCGEVCDVRPGSEVMEKMRTGG